MSKSLKLQKSHALTDRQVNFCEFYLESGKKGKAAELSGYKFPDVAAAKLLKNDDVLDYIIERVKQKHKSEIVLAHNTLIDLMQNDNDAIRYKAADAVMSRAGYLIAQEKTIRHEITDSRTDSEIKQAILALADELKLKTIDGQVVEDNQPPAIENQA